MDIRDTTSFFTNSESQWFVGQNFLQANGNLDPAMCALQQNVEATRVAAARQTIAESGLTYYREHFGKDENGNEQAIIEVPLSRAVLETILQHARVQAEKERSAAMDFDDYFASNVNVVDGSDSELFKGMIFNRKLQGLQVMDGIIAAISAKADE
ncbi:MAG TPA: hypothetical protein VLG16_03485 [Candidatus Saccharimonadales bacterium]|nr:hypothetical protein [Candidatus Saccharimonadales bacterium]